MAHATPDWRLCRTVIFNCIITIDALISYISGCLTFLGTIAVTLSSVYLAKKMNLEKKLNDNKIIITRGKEVGVSLLADKENTLTLLYKIYISNYMFPDSVTVNEVSICSAQNTESKCVITNTQNKIIAFIYPEFDGNSLVSVFIDKTAPPLAYTLVSNENKLSIDVSLEFIKNDVVTSALFCLDIEKVTRPKGIYTHKLIHPPLISIDEPFFSN